MDSTCMLVNLKEFMQYSLKMVILDSVYLRANTCFQFPHCEESDAVSVSCLDIHYYVTTKAKTPVIDDQLSDTEPIVLGTIIEDVEDLDGSFGNCYHIKPSE